MTYNSIRLLDKWKFRETKLFRRFITYLFQLLTDLIEQRIITDHLNNIINKFT